MEFADRLLQAERVLKELIKHCVENRILMQKKLAGEAGVSTRRLKEFYDLTVPEETFLAFNETISLMDFVLRHPFAESQLSDDLQYRLKALAEAMKHDAYDSTTDVARLLLASKTTGDENDFVQLEGYYLVLRRGERGRFVVSALNIFYDDRKNICHWDNVNLGTQGKIEVNGIV